jgi:excisionase family DNA binding protein
MKNDESTNAFFTVKQFAEKLRVCETTVRRAIKSGHVLAFRTGSGTRSCFRIPCSEFQRMSIENLKKILKEDIC